MDTLQLCFLILMIKITFFVVLIMHYFKIKKKYLLNSNFINFIKNIFNKILNFIIYFIYLNSIILINYKNIFIKISNYCQNDINLINRLQYIFSI